MQLCFFDDPYWKRARGILERVGDKLRLRRIEMLLTEARAKFEEMQRIKQRIESQAGVKDLPVINFDDIES